MRSRFTASDIQIVVERRGYGSRAWWWRLIEDLPGAKLNPLGEADHGYRSAECAYEAAQSSLREMRQLVH